MSSSSDAAAALFDALLLHLREPQEGGFLGGVRVKATVTLKELRGELLLSAPPTADTLKAVLNRRVTRQDAERVGVRMMGEGPGTNGAWSPNYTSPHAAIMIPSELPLIFYWVREFHRALDHTDTYLEILRIAAPHMQAGVLKNRDGDEHLVLFLIESTYRDISGGNTSAYYGAAKVTLAALRVLVRGNPDAFSLSREMGLKTVFPKYTAFSFFFYAMLLNRGEMNFLSPSRVYAGPRSDNLYALLRYLYDALPDGGGSQYPTATIMALSRGSLSYAALKFALEVQRNLERSSTKVVILKEFMARIIEFRNFAFRTKGYDEGDVPLLQHLYLLEDYGVLDVLPERTTMANVSRASPNLRAALPEEENVLDHPRLLLALYTTDFRDRFNLHIFLESVTSTLVYMSHSHRHPRFQVNVVSLIARWVNNGANKLFDKTRATVDWQRQVLVEAARAHAALRYSRLPTVDEMYRIHYGGMAVYVPGDDGASEEDEEEELGRPSKRPRIKALEATIHLALDAALAGSQ